MKKTLFKSCVRLAKNKLASHTQDFKHFTFIILDNKILSMGVNKNHTPPIYLGYHRRHEGLPKIHSEVDSIQKAKGLLRGASFELINIRMNNSGEILLSKPCSCCYSLLKLFGCRKFYYSTKKGFEVLT